jgi:hypothetical protein
LADLEDPGVAAAAEGGDDDVEEVGPLWLRVHLDNPLLFVMRFASGRGCAWLSWLGSSSSSLLLLSRAAKPVGVKK